MSFTPVQNQPSTLAGAGNSIGDTSLVLSSLLAIDGVTHLTMANFGAIGYATIEPGNGVQEEQISFTGITNNANGTDTLTGVKTVLFVTPYTESSGLAKTHPGGSQFVISNTAGFYNKFAVLTDTETISAVWTFATGASPIITDDPTTNLQAANKHYVDNVALSGAPNASTTVKGIVQEATQAQSDARTTSGSTGAELYLNPGTLRSTLVSDYKADTGAANAYAIAPSPAITAYTVGQIFSFKATNANTTTSTLNVNGLGTKTIKNSQGNNLNANDIIAGQVIVVVYDGTNFVYINNTGVGVVDLGTAQTIAGVKTFSSIPQSAGVPGSGNDVTNKTYVDGLSYIGSANGTFSKDISSTTTTTIAHGLGRVPKMLRITGSIGFDNQSFGSYNGTTQNCMYQFSNGSGSGAASTASGVITHIDKLSELNTNYIEGTAALDATNITITWAKTSSPTGTAQFIWEVI